MSTPNNKPKTTAYTDDQEWLDLCREFAELFCKISCNISSEGERLLTIEDRFVDHTDRFRFIKLFFRCQWDRAIDMCTTHDLLDFVMPMFFFMDGMNFSASEYITETFWETIKDMILDCIRYRLDRELFDE